MAIEKVEPLPVAVAAARVTVDALEAGSARPLQLQKTASSTFGRCVLGLGALLLVPLASWALVVLRAHAIFGLCSWAAGIRDCEYADVPSRA